MAKSNMNYLCKVIFSEIYRNAHKLPLKTVTFSQLNGKRAKCIEMNKFNKIINVFYTYTHKHFAILLNHLKLFITK